MGDLSPWRIYLCKRGCRLNVTPAWAGAAREGGTRGSRKKASPVSHFRGEVKRYFLPFVKIFWLRLIINKSNDEAEGNNYHEISCSSCSFFTRPEVWFNQRSAVVLSKTTRLYWIIIFLN
jgi:hypothetical protein